jgi:uncharacterized repeat protein (TIGR03803 family)
MRFIHNALAIAAVVSICAVTAASASPFTFRVVADMSQYGQPAYLTEVSPGVFYSMASSQAAFSVTSQGTQALLENFYPNYTSGWFVTGSDDRNYAISSNSKNNPTCCTVFSLGKSPGSLRTYAPETETDHLRQNLPDGSILAAAGDELSKSDLDGEVTPIAQLSGALNGSIWPVVYATDGNYYGVAETNPTAYVFRVTPSGSIAALAKLPTSGYALVQGTDGNLYGTGCPGGANNNGYVFKLTLAGQLTTLYSSEKGPGNACPWWMIQGSDGNLYVTTQQGDLSATLFQVTTSGQYTLLHKFSGGTCPCFLTQGSDGIIYGAAQSGGSAGIGYIFALDGGLPKPAPQALEFRPGHGRPGAKVRIWGHNLFKASVQFNGVSATEVSNAGSNYVFATVPTGATSGPITVTTPGGTSTTQQGSQ